MKTKINLSVFLSLAFALSPLSLNAFETLLLGGGGEPAGPETIFDGSLERLAEAKSRVPMNITASFNGGHSTTSAIIKNKIGVEHSPFTGVAYKKMIADAVKKINSGELKSGAQLMVIVDTHGGENDRQYGGKTLTHSIALSGHKMESMTNVSGAGSASVDELLTLTEAAKEKGIKLAIIDVSCHSGNSLKLANSNTCVISGTGPNHFGYSTFTKSFYNEMVPGRNLEEVFLNARKNDVDHGFPMISTNTGIKLNEDLYKLMSPYLDNRHSASADKISTRISQEARGANSCSREAEFQKLLRQVESFEKIAGEATSRYSDLSLLKDELVSYKKLQDDLIDEMISLDYKLLDKEVAITYLGVNTKNGKPLQTTSKPMSVQDILNFPPGNLSYFEELIVGLKKQSNRKEELYNMQDTVAKVKAILARQKELKIQSPNLEKSQDVLKNIDKLTETIQSKSFNVSQLSRKMYDFQYAQLVKGDAAPNPCKDFKL